MKTLSIAILALFAATTFAHNLKSLQKYPIEVSSLIKKKKVALTFDDGPLPGSTESILDTLKEYNIKATFFVLGKNAKMYPAIMKRIYDEGHIVANHSYNHANLSKLSRRKVKKQIVDTHEQIDSYMVDGKWYFRAPYNAWKKRFAHYVNKNKIVDKYVGPVMWDIGGSILEKDGKVINAADWACWVKPYRWPVEKCAKGYLIETERKNGGIMLLHDIHNSSAKMIKIIIPALKSRGYTFVNLDEVSSLKKY